MKTLLLSITLILSSFLINAQTDKDEKSEGTTIKVTITINGSGGKILVGLHNEYNFMKMPLDGMESEIVDGKAEVIFNNVAPGSYGIIVLHDKNDNNRMDYNDDGMPLEAYGMSNNVISYGPPQWNDAKFDVLDSPVDMEIRL